MSQKNVLVLSGAVLLCVLSLSATEKKKQVETVVELTATADVQAATVIDFGVTIPPGATLKIPWEFFGKNGAEPGDDGWQSCGTGGRCGTTAAAFDANMTKTVPLAKGGLTLQSRIVNDPGTVVRGRIVVHYYLPLSSITQ